MFEMKKHFLEGILSHIILIETNNQDFCVEEIKEFAKELSCLEKYSDECNKCNLCSSIDKEESLNFFIVKPEGKMIKKEQIRYIQEKCSKKPVISKNNVYVICNVEKLMPNTANMMLKFIEEPYNNTYGFLITNNKEGVINTIKSRCETYTINYANEKSIDVSILNKAKEYLELVEGSNSDLIINKSFFTKEEKNYTYMEDFFKYILSIYTYYLNGNEDYIDYTISLLNGLNKKDIIKRVKVVTDILNNMKYNLNIELMLDRFIIEVGEKNE